MPSRVLKLLVLISLLLGACSPATPAPASSSAPVSPSEPKRAANQVLHVAQTAIPASLSPEISLSNIAFYSAIFDTVVDFGKDFAIKPQVAERWEFSGGSWRFYLRKDVKFSDGTPLTAEDVAFSLNNIIQGNLPQRTYLPTISEAKVIDQFTVEVSSKNPDTSVLNGMPWAFVFSKAYYQKVGKEAFQTKPMGSGPYEVVDFKASDSAHFRKRTEKHPFREPIASELYFQSVPEISAVVNGLRTGDVDLTAHVAFSAEQSEAMQRDGIGVLTLQASNVTALMSQPENEQRQTPLRNKRVRKALNYAIDREALGKNLYKGLAQPVGQLSIPSSPFWIPDVKPYPYDPAKAKQLLAEAGYPNGFKLPVGIDFPPSAVNPQLALALQGYLKDIGVEATVNSLELAVYQDKSAGRNGQTKGDLWMSAAGDATGTGSSWRGTFDCEKPAAAITWCNKEFNRIFDQALNEPNDVKRKELLNQAHRVFLDDVPIVFLVITPLFIAESPKIKGVEFTSPVVFRFDNAYRVE